MTIANTIKSAGARLTMSSEDVRALLKKDHDEFKDLLSGLVDGGQGRSRANLLEALKKNLTAHSRAEEQVVYDAMIRMRAKKDVHVLAEEGYVEHGAVDDLLARISRLDVGTDLWLAHAKVIREMLEHHIAEEQNEIFAELGDLFSSDELVAMGEQFLRRKARVLTQQASKKQRNIARVVAGQRARKTASRVTTKKTAKKTTAVRRSTAGGQRSASSGRTTRRRAR
ncbi:MAG TPA: hemerythrin domain-containing protein [Rudaea sp.]|nr:hemerythrin domain-containing protein [Rudaea sp.]